MPCRRPVLAGELSVSQCDRQAAALTWISPGQMPACLLSLVWGWRGRVSTGSVHQGGPHRRSPASPSVHEAQPPEVLVHPGPERHHK